MPPFKVYKVMQDINQQLYENKSTPEGFIPVYGVVITVPTGIYTNGQKEFTCDKTFDEVKEILLKGGSIIAVDNNNSRINFDRIDIGNNSFSATITYFSNGGINAVNGGNINVAAPGVDIFSSYTQKKGNLSGYKLMSGTSMATPHVSGMAALYMEEFPQLSALEIWKLLEDRAKSITSLKYRDIGNGLIQKN